MGSPNSKIYNLPKDKISLLIILAVFIPLLIAFIYGFVRFPFFQDPWNDSLFGVLFLLAIFFFIKSLSYYFKGLTLQFTSEGIMINNKLRMGWDQIKDYEKREKSVLLISKDPVLNSNFYGLKIYGGELNEEIDYELKKRFKENKINTEVLKNKSNDWKQWVNLILFMILGIFFILLGIYFIKNGAFIWGGDGGFTYITRIDSPISFWIAVILTFFLGAFTLYKTLKDFIKKK